MVRSYLSPEPLLQSPAYVRQMAQSGLSVPTYAYALNNPVRYVDRNGLEVWIDDSDWVSWARAWQALGDAMNDPEIGFAVTALVRDPNYTLYIWPHEGLGGRQGGVTSPRENENACDLSLDRERGRSPDGIPMTFKGDFFHELGHAVWFWRWDNKNVVWRSLVPGGDRMPFFAEPWMRAVSESEALRFENRTIRGPPWRTVHY